jgi:hypothetical protein
MDATIFYFIWLIVLLGVLVTCENVGKRGLRIIWFLSGPLGWVGLLFFFTLLKIIKGLDILFKKIG